MVLLTRQHARKEGFQFEKPHRKTRKSPPLEKNRRDSESFGWNRPDRGDSHTLDSNSFDAKIHEDCYGNGHRLS